jgi:hypothetical protein
MTNRLSVISSSILRKNSVHGSTGSPRTVCASSKLGVYPLTLSIVEGSDRLLYCGCLDRQQLKMNRGSTGKADLPLDRVVDTTVVKEVLSERR